MSTLDAGRLRLTVSDNGGGRNPQAWSHGLGLGGVRKRVKQLGGEVQWRELAAWHRLRGACPAPRPAELTAPPSARLRDNPRMNPLLARLHPYPFERWRELTRDIVPPPGLRPSAWASASRATPTPALIEEALVQALPGLSSYPATVGEPALREAIAGWVQRRYGVALDPGTQVLPVNGSREALFALAQTRDRPDAARRHRGLPQSLLPDLRRRGPAGRRADRLRPSDPARNFAADWGAVDEATWARTQLLYVCSPGNPTGAVMPLAEWQQLFELSDRHGFVIASDECYSEIYFRDEPPLGGAAGRAGAGPRRLPQPGRVHQPVQAQQRAGPALRLRRRRRGADQGLPALPHLPRQRDGPGGAARQHRGLERRGPRGGQPRALPRQVRAGHAAAGRVLDVRCPTPASTSGRGPVGAGCRGEATTSPSPAACSLNTMSTVLPGSLLARDSRTACNPGAGPHPHGAGGPRRRMPGSRPAHRSSPSHCESLHDPPNCKPSSTSPGRPRRDLRRQRARRARRRRARHRRPQRRPPARGRAPGRGRLGVNQWVKKAVLLSFRLNDNKVMRAGDLGFFDKVPTKFAHLDEAADARQRRARGAAGGGAARQLHREERGADAQLREHRRLRRRRHDGRHLGHRRLAARRSARTCTCRAASASAACSSRCRPTRRSSRTTASSARAPRWSKA